MLFYVADGLFKFFPYLESNFIASRQSNQLNICTAWTTVRLLLLPGGWYGVEGVCLYSGIY